MITKHLLFGITVVASLALAATPVCIIGAGPAGLAAAQSLQNKGRDYVVFEKDPSVGGKSKAVYRELVHTSEKLKRKKKNDTC